MVKLKSYSSFKKKKKPMKLKVGKDLVTGGVTAMIGLGLLSATAGALRRI